MTLTLIVAVGQLRSETSVKSRDKSNLSLEERMGRLERDLLKLSDQVSSE